MIRVSPNALCLPALLALAACGGGGGEPGTGAADTSGFAGLWDASEDVDGTRDERYVSISADGDYTVYDYRQDDLADEGNCYGIAELSLESIGTRDVEYGGNALFDAEPIVIEGAATYRLSDRRTVSLHVFETYTDFEDDSGRSQEEFVRSLVSVFGEEPSTSSAEWVLVTGLSEVDLAPCESA